MHRLTRQVRFSINPFLPEQTEGANSFASKPAGEGLSIFFELSAELVGEADPVTGFVVNVTDIDRTIRDYAVPVFINRIKENFGRTKHIDFFAVIEILSSAREQLADKFGTARLSKLSLKLNPFRKIALCSEDSNMAYLSEKFEFAATHKLWNDCFDEKKNLEIFGKCANPTGHGHNYIIEVTLKIPADRKDFSIADFEKTVDREFIKLVDHKNLNIDVEHFGKVNPTVENIASFAWKKLIGKFGNKLLHCVTIWETDKTSCSFYG